MIGDKGYQGTGLTTPYKKPRGRDLTDVRRACNTAINRVRAAVERAIAHLKNWKILKTGYRPSLHDFPRVLRTVTKLEIFENLRMTFEKASRHADWAGTEFTATCVLTCPSTESRRTNRYGRSRGGTGSLSACCPRGVAQVSREFVPVGQNHPSYRHPRGT